MMQDEYDAFLRTWDAEAAKAIQLMKALPADKYDFRPDPGGRSLGELSWHLAEVDAYMSLCVEQGAFPMGAKPPGLERPLQVDALAPGFERVHREARARVAKLKPADLDKPVNFADGGNWRGSDVLWKMLLYHFIHHRGQLALMCRMAGGVSPGMYGPNREEWAAVKARMAGKA